MTRFIYRIEGQSAFLDPLGRWMLQVSQPTVSIAPLRFIFTEKEGIVSHQASLWSMSSLQRVVKVAAAFVTSIGCLVLIGWIVDISILKSLLPGLVSMKANTAVGFVLAGTSLLLSAEPTASKWRLVGRVCSLIVAAIGLVTLSEYLWGWELGIDQWLFPDDPQPVGTSNPGRMSPLGAFC
ncbi:MAG: hypothetical protein AB1589_46140, partial [Cyanobacteriota bacterium]